MSSPTVEDTGVAPPPRTSPEPAHVGAMPKLPARPSNIKQRTKNVATKECGGDTAGGSPASAPAHCDATDGLTSSAADSGRDIASDSNNGSSKQAGPSPTATTAVASSTASSTPSSSAAPTPAAIRPSVGPLLPPRAGRTAAASTTTSGGGRTSSKPAAAGTTPAGASKASRVNEGSGPAPAQSTASAPGSAAEAPSNSTTTTTTTATSTADTITGAAPPSPANPSAAIASSARPSGGAAAASPTAAAASRSSAGPSPGPGYAPTTTSGSGGGSGGGGVAGRKPLAGGLSALPPRSAPLAAPAQGPVLDPDEPESVAEVRRSIHNVRVQMISAALRLGYDHENALVKQVLYRLTLAERLKAPWRRPGKRPDPVAAAAREAAARAEEAKAAGAAGGIPPPLGFTVKIMLIGLQGSGKTQLAHALLGSGTAVHPFEGATRRVSVLRGSALGVGLELVDTPGLCLAPGGAARNNQVLQQIRRAFHSHRPDLLMYVDRLDAPTPVAGPTARAREGSAGTSVAGSPMAGAELSVLRSLQGALGQEMWLNTIVTFTHAGSPPPTSYLSPGGRPHAAPPSFESWLELRSHALQMVIRQASNDERLMNPVAFAESHPSCPLNQLGQPVLYNGMPWRSHVLLMATSAKLLADTEALLHRQPGGGGVGGKGGGGAGAAAAGAAGGGSAAALREMMATARQVPMSYIMQQVTQVSRPLKFPDHQHVMDVRRARRDAARLPDPRRQREAAQQVALRVWSLRQAGKKRRAVAEQFRTGSTAGGKVTPEPPRMATRCRPSALPAEGFRYRSLEAQGGWVVRPHIESHCADNSDGVEGFVLNKVGVAAPGGPPGADDGLMGHGVPYHHYVSAQYTKDQRLLAARSEATLYLDPVGAATTSMSVDVQTNSNTGGLPGPHPEADVLMVLRTDTRVCPGRQSRAAGSSGGGLPKVTLGAVVARVGGEGRLPLGLPLPLPLRGPTAVGLRVQATKKTRLGPAAAPLRFAACAAAMQRTSELAAGRLGLGLGLRGRGSAGVGGEEACLGASAEVEVELADLLDLPLARKLPAALGVSVIRSPEGVTTAMLTSSVQYQLGPREALAVRASWDKRGRAGVSLRVKSVSGWWAGLVAMVLPLGRFITNWGLDTLRHMRALAQLRRQQRLKQQREERQQQTQTQQVAGGRAKAQKQTQKQKQTQAQKQRPSKQPRKQR